MSLEAGTKVRAAILLLLNFSTVVFVRSEKEETERERETGSHFSVQQEMAVRAYRTDGTSLAC